MCIITSKFHYDNSSSVWHRSSGTVLHIHLTELCSTQKTSEFQESKEGDNAILKVPAMVKMVTHFRLNSNKTPLRQYLLRRPFAWDFEGLGPGGNLKKSEQGGSVYFFGSKIWLKFTFWGWKKCNYFFEFQIFELFFWGHSRWQFFWGRGVRWLVLGTGCVTFLYTTHLRRKMEVQ